MLVIMQAHATEESIQEVCATIEGLRERHNRFARTAEGMQAHEGRAPDAKAPICEFERLHPSQQGPIYQLVENLVVGDLHPFDSGRVLHGPIRSRLSNTVTASCPD